MRRVAIGLCGVLLVVLVAIGAAIAYRIPLAGWAIRRTLARAGYPDASFSIDRFDREAATLVGFRSGDALRVDRLEVFFDFSRLPQPPVERLRIVGARIDLSKREPTAQASQSGPSAFPPALLPALELQDVAVVAPSPVGPLTITMQSQVEHEAQSLHMRLEAAIEGESVKSTLRGEARLDQAGMVSMSVQMESLTVRHPRLRIGAGSASLRCDAESSGFDVKHAQGRIDATLRDVLAGESPIGEMVIALPLDVSHGAGGWSAKVAGGEVRLPARSLRFAAISADASAAAADVRIDRIEDTGKNRRFEPLALHGNFTGEAPLRRFTADVTTASGHASLHAAGTYDPAAGATTIDLSFPRLSFDPAGLKPSDLSPLLEPLGSAKGGLSATTRLRWTSGQPIDGTAALGFDHLSIDAERLRIDDLDGKLELTRLNPPQTAGVQTTRAHELHPGVAFSDAALGWALEPLPEGVGSRLRIESFVAGFGGGHVTIHDALLDPLAAENRLEFGLEEIDVAKLFEIASLEGVSGSGRLSGAIPVLVRGGQVAIAKSDLNARGGVLQMRSQKVASVLAGGGQSVQLLLDVLADFHYDQLTVTIEKDFGGEAAVRVHLEGNNPAVLEGQAFRINLNLTGNLDRLVASLVEIARLSDRAVRSTVRGIKPEAR